MTYIAIKRKKDGAFVSGSDKRYYPPHCIMADDYRSPLLLPCDMRNVKGEIKRRQINMSRYKTVVVEIKEVERNDV